MFFTEENLKNIFEQIVDHESKNESKVSRQSMISHSSVVDILYNVFNQINENNQWLDYALQF